METEKKILLDVFDNLGLQNNNGSERNALKAEQLITFVYMIQKWNKTYNLTALKNVADMVSHHIIDSLAVIPNLNAYFLQKKISFPNILDVGT